MALTRVRSGVFLKSTEFSFAWFSIHTLTGTVDMFNGKDGLSVFVYFFIHPDSRTAVEILAVSLAQGGPASKFLQDWCNNFFLTVSLENIAKGDVHDLEFSSLINRVGCKTNCILGMTASGVSWILLAWCCRSWLFAWISFIQSSLTNSNCANIGWRGEEIDWFGTF